MKTQVFIFFVSSYLAKFFPNDDFKIDVKLNNVFIDCINQELPIHFFTKTLEVIEFYSQRVEVWNTEEMNLAYQMILGFISTAFNKDYNGQLCVLRSFTSKPAANRRHGNRKYFECNELLAQILGR